MENNLHHDLLNTRELLHTELIIKTEDLDEDSEDIHFSCDLNEQNNAFIHTSDKLFSCDVCERTFTGKQSLVYHKRIHIGEKQFSCEVCEKKFCEKSHLVEHVRIHTGEKPFSCDVCGKKFTQNSILTRHKRIHTGDKPFPCDMCHKTFTLKQSLVYHQRTHTGEKPFSCDLCEKKFIQEIHLIEHIRFHTGEKPYSCDVCEKVFHIKKNLIKHKRVHSGEKPFACEVCGKKFSQNSVLIRHKRIHTGEKPFSCDAFNKHESIHSVELKTETIENMKSEPFTITEGHSVFIINKEESETASMEDNLKLKKLPKKHFGAKKHCRYGVCRSDTRRKTFLENQYFFVNFPKPCLEYRQKRIKTTAKNHIKTCPKCSKCDLWVKQCGRNDGRFQTIDHVNKDTYICSLHFMGGSGPTTEYPDPISCVKSESHKKIKIIPRTSLSEKYKQINDNINQSAGVSNTVAENMECENGAIHEDAVDVRIIENSVTSLSTLNVTSTLNLNSGNVDDIPMATVTSDNYKSLATQTHADDAILSSIKCCDQSVQTNVKKLSSKRTQVRLHQVSVMEKFENSLKSDIKKSKFYTSLAYDEIIILHKFVNLESKNMEDKNYREKKSNNCVTKLTSIQQLILVLVRLRLGLLVEDLAYRFEISTTLVSTTIKFWIQYLFDKFSKTWKPLMFPLRQTKENVPKTIIVDCTAFQCQSPSTLEHQGNLKGKVGTTYKALIGCTPNGGVCFVSDVYEGGVSDREIFIKSNISDHLKPGDLVLADRGFAVHDIVESKQAYLNVPPFLNGRKQLSPQEEMEMKRITKQRMYLKHVIERIKRFRVLRKVLPFSLRSSMSQTVFVCACLVNFQPGIIND